MVTIVISDRIGLNSVLLPFHLSVADIRRSDGSNVSTEYGFHFRFIVIVINWVKLLLFLFSLERKKDTLYKYIYDMSQGAWNNVLCAGQNVNRAEVKA